MLRRAAFFLALAAGATSIAVAPADAATARTVGAVSYATQDTFTHRLLVRGWAYDTAASARPIVVRSTPTATTPAKHGPTTTA